MEKFTKQNGITLIALIITIIVMLILVAVTISVALNGGLFNNAREARTGTQRESDREQLMAAAVATVDSNGDFHVDKILPPEGFTGSDGTYTNTKTGKQYKVDETTGRVEEYIPLTFADVAGKYYQYQENEKITTAYFNLNTNGTGEAIDPNGGLTTEKSFTYQIDGNVIVANIGDLTIPGAGSFHNMIIKLRYSEENGTKQLEQYHQSADEFPNGEPLSIMYKQDAV